MKCERRTGVTPLWKEGLPHSRDRNTKTARHAAGALEPGWVLVLNSTVVQAAAGAYPPLSMPNCLP
jgi:hypothetical protein